MTKEYTIDPTPRAKPIREMSMEDISREMETGSPGRTWDDFTVGDKTIRELLEGSKNKSVKKGRKSRSKKSKKTDDEPVKFRDAFPDLVEE